MDANRGLFGKDRLWARTLDKQAVLSSRCVREIGIARLSHSGTAVLSLDK
jgi:hypothetical protein